MIPLFGENNYLHPDAKWLFLLLPILFWYEWKKLKSFRLPLSSLRLVDGVAQTWRQRTELLPLFARLLGGAFLIYALMMPQVVNQKVQVHSEGVDMVLAIDTSGSMNGEDMILDGARVNRMRMVKQVVSEFVKGRVYDRIGMVVFGEQAYTQCPLTLDYDVLTGYLDLIEVGIAGDATAIGNALAMSTKRLLESKAKSRVVILLTDGENTAGEVSPKDAMELAASQGIKVYTIAVGSRSKRVPFPVKTFFGIQYREVELPVDEDLLREIAQKTGGQFFRADSTETLRNIYKTIEQLEKTKVDVEKFTESEERFDQPLMAALLFLILAFVLQNTVYVRAP